MWSKREGDDMQQKVHGKREHCRFLEHIRPLGRDTAMYSFI